MTGYEAYLSGKVNYREMPFAFHAAMSLSPDPALPAHLKSISIDIALQPERDRERVAAHRAFLDSETADYGNIFGGTDSDTDSDT